MKSMGTLAVLTATLALGACGTHGNPNPYGAGPVYYSADAPRHAQTSSASTARSDAAGRRDSGAPALQPTPSKRIDEAQLQPVSMLHLASANETPAAGAQTRRPADNRVVTVQSGDTVYALGRRHQVSPQAIIAENNLRAPYHLEIGQTIRLPAGAASAAAEPMRKVVARDAMYQVRAGDTLYSISRAHDVEHTTIAQANNLRPPYLLEVGQQLLIPQARVDEPIQTAAAPAYSAEAAASAAKAGRPTPTSPAPSEPIPSAPPQPKDVEELAAQSVSFTPPPQPKAPGLFDWPVRGAVIAQFGAGELGRRNDGVNIAAPKGTPVRAAADGEVVYRGSELDGFGNLLLVRHSDGYVTAYAHNDSMLVQKGQQVRQGQVIAKVGESGSVTTPQLHFEIRQNLKSVDPTALLGPQ